MFWVTEFTNAEHS